MPPGTAPPTASCAVCGAGGPVGAPCTTPRCHKRGYHFIPPGYAADDDAVVDGIVGQRWGDYLIVTRLTEGGVGAIYLALQLPLMMKAAVKILATDAPPSLADRLRDEAAALARLSHPNIVRLLKYGEAARRAYMVMEYVDGGRTLADAMDDGELDQPASLRILRELISALDAAHRHQVVHRDIKPQNIMLQRLSDDPHFVRLVDFGLAKFTDGGRASTMIAAGTPAYMAPEQILRQGIGPWTDWYAVAMLAAEMLLDHRPFADIATDDVIRYKLAPGFDAAASLERRGLAPPVMHFFRWALASDPTERIRDTDDFKQAFEAMAEALSPTAPAARSPAQRPATPRAPMDRVSLRASIDAIPDPEADFDPDETMRSDDSAAVLMAKRLRQAAKLAQEQAARSRAAAAVEDDEPTRPSRVWPAETPVTQKGLLGDREPTAPIPPVGGHELDDSQADMETLPKANPVVAPRAPVAQPVAPRPARALVPAPDESPPPTAQMAPLPRPAAPAPRPAAPAPPPRQRTMLVEPIRDEPEVPSAPPRWRSLALLLFLVGLGVLGAVVWLVVNPPGSR